VRRLLIALLILTGLTRLLAWHSMAVISADGARFLRMARDFHAGRFDDALSVEAFPPLYPLLIATLHRAGIGWEAAARLISLLAALPACAALFVLARAVWNERIATIACLIFALAPEYALHGADTMSESLFMALFTGAMALAWTGWASDRPERLLGAGLAAGAAYLTRPEGVYLAPLLAFACAIHAWKHRRDRARLARVGLGLAAALVAAGAAAMPYLIHIRGTLGRWSLTPNPYANLVIEFVRGKKPQDPDLWRGGTHRRLIERFGRPLGAAISIGDSAARIVFFAPLAFWLIGLARPLREAASRSGLLFVHAAAAGYTVPNYLAFFAGAPFGDRYVLVPFLLWMPVMAVGARAIGDRLRGWLRPASRVLVLAWMCAALVVSGRPKRTDKIALRLAGEEILRVAGPGRRVASQDRRVEYYAQGDWRRLEYPQVLGQASRGDVEFIVVIPGERRDPGREAVEEFDRRYRRIATISAGGRTAFVWSAAGR
jgi:4-amino-4-deoxy-L-arabinose transferase-like glycosyltransferase